MHRTIATATLVFAVAAFALHSASIGPFEEPLLLLMMGTLFLVVGKLLAPQRVSKRAPPEAEPEPSPAPQLVPRRQSRA
jgi:hypothetical protein